MMQACSPIGSILKAVDPSGSSSASLSQSGVPPGLDSADLCINMGLFQLSFGVDKLGISYNIGLSCEFYLFICLTEYCCDT